MTPEARCLFDILHGTPKEVGNLWRGWPWWQQSGRHHWTPYGFGTKEGPFHGCATTWRGPPPPSPADRSLAPPDSCCLSPASLQCLLVLPEPPPTVLSPLHCDDVPAWLPCSESLRHAGSWATALVMGKCWRIKLVSTYDSQAYGSTPFSPRGFPRFLSIRGARGSLAFDLALM
jgi:hypothetical protein